MVDTKAICCAYMLLIKGEWPLFLSDLYSLLLLVIKDYGASPYTLGTRGFFSRASGSFVSSAASGRKNVLRKPLRIPYRRLKAGFSVC